jgi:hypothetical protein
MGILRFRFAIRVVTALGISSRFDLRSCAVEIIISLTVALSDRPSITITKGIILRSRIIFTPIVIRERSGSEIVDALH